MKLVWHIFLKDLRRLRLALALWGGLFVLQYAGFLAFGRVPDHSEHNAVTRILVLETFCGLQLLVAWLLVPLLLHDDPLVGDHAGWRTRPISGCRLLAAKLLGAVVMLGLWPSLCLLPWWVQFGFGPGEILSSVAANLVSLALLTSLAAAVAMLTRDLLRFLGWSFVLGLGVMQLVFSISNSTVLGDPGVTGELLATRMKIAALLAGLGVVVITIVQFFTRRHALGLIVAGVTAVTVGFAGRMWPWTASELRAALGSERSARPAVSGAISGVTLFVPPAIAKAKAALQFDLAVTAPNLARGDDMIWETFEGTLRHGELGRLPLTLRLQSVWRLEHYDDPNEQARPIVEGRGDERAPFSVAAHARIEVPAALAPRLREGSASLAGDLAGGWWRGELEARLPFREGAADSRGLNATRLLRIRGRNMGEPGNFIEWVNVSPVFTPEHLVVRLALDHGGAFPNRQHVLSGRGAFWLLNSEWSWTFGRPRTQLEPAVGGVMLRGMSSEYYPDSDSGRRSERRGDATRFDQATWATVAFQETERLGTRIDVPKLLPDLVVEADLAVALRRAKAENKRVLAIVQSRAFDPALEVVPDAWHILAVRELVKANFVCVEVYQPTEPRLQVLNWDRQNPRFVVLTSDGTRQDAWNSLSLVTTWKLALAAAARGTTFVAALREEMAKPGSKVGADYLGDALLGRGELAAGIDQILQHAVGPADAKRWRQLFNLPSGAVTLESLVTAVPEARPILRQQRDAALARLARAPRDPEAARRLFVLTFALKEVDAWKELPRLLPQENPERWRVMDAWIWRSTSRDQRLSDGNQRPLVPEEVDWESFFQEGQRWIQAMLADARREVSDNDYFDLSLQARYCLVRLGVRGTQVLAKAGQKEQAARLAEEVRRFAGYRGHNVGLVLDDALQGRLRDNFQPFYELLEYSN